MIKEIKNRMINLKGKKIKIIVDVGRNKKEKYKGKIKECFDNIWLFETESDIKSFSYKDILIKNVIISSL